MATIARTDSSFTHADDGSPEAIQQALDRLDRAFGDVRAQVGAALVTASTPVPTSAPSTEDTPIAKLREELEQARAVIAEARARIRTLSRVVNPRDVSLLIDPLMVLKHIGTKFRVDEIPDGFGVDVVWAMVDAGLLKVDGETFVMTRDAIEIDEATVVALFAERAPAPTNNEAEVERLRARLRELGGL